MVRRMKVTHIDEAQRPDGQALAARALMNGDQSSVRIIRLAPGQALPPHKHGSSDVMLYVIAGQGELEGAGPINAGALAYLRGDEELRVRNVGQADLALLAFLAPPLS
jgi:quercetin dioxygenase-like cupin family protein